MAKKRASARKKIVKKVVKKTTKRKSSIKDKAVKRKLPAKKKSQPSMFKNWRPGPLNSSFMATSLIGLLISVYMIFPKSSDFGIASILIFTTMFISSLISMHKAPPITN